MNTDRIAKNVAWVGMMTLHLLFSMIPAFIALWILGNWGAVSVVANIIALILMAITCYALLKLVFVGWFSMVALHNKHLSRLF